MARAFLILAAGGFKHSCCCPSNRPARQNPHPAAPAPRPSIRAGQSDPNRSGAAGPINRRSEHGQESQEDREESHQEDREDRAQGRQEGAGPVSPAVKAGLNVLVYGFAVLGVLAFLSVIFHFVGGA